MILKFFGVFLMIVGVVFGVYSGLWWAFIGGIITIIEQIQSPPVDPYSVAFAIAKIMGAGPIGVIAGLIFWIPGVVLCNVKVNAGFRIKSEISKY